MNIEFKPAEDGKIWEAVVMHDEPICLGKCTQDGSTEWIFIPYDDVWFDSSELTQITWQLKNLNIR